MVHDDAIARPRTGREGESASQGLETGRGERARTEAQVWEIRRKKCEEIMGYVGTKLEAAFWVIGAVLVIYYTNIVRVMFNHKGVNK